MSTTNGGDAEFRKLTMQDARRSMHDELEKLIATAPAAARDNTSKEFAEFERLFAQFLENSGPSVDWRGISSPSDEAVKVYNELPLNGTDEQIRDMLDKLVVLKLNGGLGTSMGCTGPKSLICVRNEHTFLDLTVQQIENLNKRYGADVPLVLMNSFNTHEDTLKTLRKYQQYKVKILNFMQSRFPRINRESLLPLASSMTDEEHEAWYPPGHGDVYSSLLNSGYLTSFLAQGKRFVFVSNIDNLGATVDLKILNYLLNPPSGVAAPEFVMEVTDKTKADIKGGTLTNYEGKLRLLEISQVPKDYIDEFKSVSKFKIFNTNNLWISLPAIHRVLQNGSLHMEIIANPKTLDNGQNVLQLETAAGAAIKCFDGAIGINVPRSRFLPVKLTSDLMLVMSNLYTFNTGCLQMSPKRAFQTVPLVKLGRSFVTVKEFLSRFASIPDILELDHLTVSGDVTFGKGVTLKGTVIIIANHGERIDIPQGAMLENKIVSGNLRILDH